MFQPKDFECRLFKPPRESIDVLDVRSITTRHGTYTQYLVHWQGKPHSKDAWISSEELKKLDHLLWEELNSNLKACSFQAGENDAGVAGVNSLLSRVDSCVVRVDSLFSRVNSCVTGVDSLLSRVNSCV